jgi:hypothetical protein
MNLRSLSGAPIANLNCDHPGIPYKRSSPFLPLDDSSISSSTCIIQARLEAIIQRKMPSAAGGRRSTQELSGDCAFRARYCRILHWVQILARVLRVYNTVRRKPHQVKNTPKGYERNCAKYNSTLYGPLDPLDIYARFPMRILPLEMGFFV